MRYPLSNSLLAISTSSIADLPGHVRPTDGLHRRPTWVPGSHSHAHTGPFHATFQAIASIPVKVLGRRSGIFLAFSAAALLALPALASAASISVTTQEDVLTGPACSLRAAISAANADSAVGGCAAGSGPDTISVPRGTFEL